MGNHVVKVPDVGEGIAEVELVSWSVSAGDTVSRNQVLAEVMTDKANVEIPSPVDGVVAAVHGELGAKLAVGNPLVELDVAGDGPATPRPAVRTAGSTAGSAATRTAGSTAGSTTWRQDPAPARPGEAAARSPSGPVPGVGSGADGPPRAEGERPRAAPAVRYRARQAGIDLRYVPGTGPAGRITHDDLDTFARRSTGAPAPAANGAPAAAAPAPGQRAAPDTSVVERPIIGVRRVIAERMVASTRSIPHITYVEEVDVTALEELRSTLNESRGQDQPRLTLLPFLIRALVNHLPEHPELNAHVDDERGMLRLFGAVHVGIATQTSNGLVVPVVRHAETGTIWSLAARVAAAAEAAREGTAAPSDLSGSTITITSLGPMGGLVTTPVINKPEVAIVGVNKIAIRPVWADGMFVPRKVMNLSSSFDHRIVDGWEAASFVQHLRASLEQPALLFVDRS